MLNIQQAIGTQKEPKYVGDLLKGIFFHYFKLKATELVKKRGKETYEINDVIKTILAYFCKQEDFNKYGLIKEASLNKGILIYGDYGVGKSVLMEAIHLAGKELHDRRISKDFWFNRITAAAFVQRYMDHVDEPETTFNIKNYYKGTLYIDDLGFEQKAFNKTELFGQVLFERHRELAITHVTTNNNPLEIMGRYGERIGDRLEEMFNIIHWKGDSLR